MKTFSISTASHAHIEARAIPIWGKKCYVCGASPVVRLITASGECIYDTQMCGVCLWGEAACSDPKEWASP